MDKYKVAFDYVATEKAIAMLLRFLAHHGVPRRHLCSGLPTRRRIPRSPDVYEEFVVNKVYCWSVVANGEDNGGVCLETKKTSSFPETESKVDEESKNAVVLLPSVESRETVTEMESRYVPLVLAITIESADAALVEKEKRRRRRSV
ncbi:hypothetical protein EV2_026462 [Malus domestica]